MSNLTEQRAAIKRKTGLTDRQLELLVSVAAYEAAFGDFPRAYRAGDFLAGKCQLALLKPPVSFERSYACACYRLERLGFIKPLRGESAATCLMITPAGRTKLASLSTGSPEPVDILKLALRVAS